MSLNFNRLVLSIFITGALMLACVPVGRSEVVVFDGVTTVQTPIRITVLTKGRIFSQGGRLVDIYLDGRHLKNILTGGDGYGYLKYIPQNPGLKEINARSDADSSSGLILVMDKSEKAVIIDLAGAFKDAIFSKAVREDSRKVVTALSQDYKIIYLSRYVGQGVSRSWLEQEDFPISIILPWQGPESLKTLEKRGVQLYAVIGSATVISAAKKHVAHRYTFEESKDGTIVKDWDEILKLLQPAAPTGSPERDPK